MRSGLLILGIALIILGGVIYSIGNNGAQEYRTSLGQIARGLSSDAQQQYQTYATMESLGGIGALIGIVLSITGAISSSGEKSGGRIKRKVIVKRGSKTARCPVCGCLLDVSDKSGGTCPDCKNPLEILYEG
ncbi:MAG: hypothetical protein O8C64_11305 [Candidatus Methanoperedens sp.]|nr:hypothetical protein [Candidatus Methanoperedens sp.]MCZ7403956.1 hypothetical protein [Candidatus Methanoperedens sp.]